jgi:hypothetical protein
MKNTASSSVTRAALILLRETFEGPSGPSTYFVDNNPKAGLFATIEGLNAEEVSQPFGGSGASIAGHVHHVGFHLDMSSAWLRGDREPRDWSQSWTITTLDEPRWAALRSRLRHQFEDLVRAIESEPTTHDEDLATVIGAIAHAAYHLGAIRQRLAGQDALPRTGS